MTTPFIIPAAMMILSGSIHAVVNAILKSGKDRMVGRALIDGSSALFLLPALLIVPLPTGAWVWLALSTLIHLVYLFSLVRAFDHSDLSAAYPVLRGTAPLLTAAIMIGLIGEDVTTGQIIGIALIGIGMFTMVVGRHLSRAGLGWSLLTGTTIALYTVVDAHGVRAAPNPASYIVWMFVLMGGSISLMFGWLARHRIRDVIASQWRIGMMAGAMSIVTYGLALWALALGPTAPLAALRETSMITALLIGTFVLKETVTPARLLGVLAIFAGGAFILIR